MTLAAIVILVSGVVLELLQELWDGYGPWLGKQSPLVKRVVALGVNLVGALVVFGITCVGFLGILFPGVELPCDSNGILLLLGVWLAMVVPNQIAHAVRSKFKQRG